ncbi:hypothetical protein P6166_16965 [Stenotrophomonas sp. HITSZ_GD]|uniref:hypothetical protein n=1 Tax=Stenotrophomonas sp. HITSZ_GD TaxID=3037248 RepID=UPI00240D401E|nr:hypothetical protein [Stenotrophomonas sp. HITSZ_GD]MDG2527046.1 hypothetical protein [Stenotrophomonas sp. HITSZ_GD]
MAGDNLSLMRGGPTHRLLDRLRLIGPGTRSATWLCVILLVLTFVPLAMYCALDGTLWRTTHGMPLLRDYAVLSRFLLALPALVLMAPRSDEILRQAARQFAYSSLVAPSRQAALRHALGRVRQLRDARAPELICLLLACLASTTYGPTLGDRLPGVASWSVDANGRLTQAALWLHYVSMPLFRFVMLVWLWRLLLWTCLLWRLVRQRLDLHASHPDGAAGLGFLGLAQERFAVLSLANGFVLCGAFANRMLYLGESMFSLRYLIAGYLMASSALVLLPLLLLAPTLLRVKRHALLRYDALGNRAARTFDQRWPRGLPAGDTRELLDSPDASALCDFTGVYATIKNLPAVPIGRWSLVRIFLYAAMPLSPLLLLVFSVDELATRLFGLLA